MGALPASSRKFRIPIRNLVVSLVALTIMLTATLAISLQYYFSRDLAISAAAEAYQTIAQSTSDYIEQAQTRSEDVTNLLANYPDLADQPLGSLEARDIFAVAMQGNRTFYSIFLGYPNGDFFQVINLSNDHKIAQHLKALPTDRWLTIRISENDDGRRAQMSYYNDQFQLRARNYESSQYDPRKRIWYENAEINSVSKSEPYLFEFAQVSGQTFSTRLNDEGVVLGVDITHRSISGYLKSLPLSKKGDLFIYRSDGQVLAYNHSSASYDRLPAVPKLELSPEQQQYINDLGDIRISNEEDWPPIDFTVAGQPQGYSIDVIKLLSRALGLKVTYINGYSWPELVKAFRAGDIDVLQPVVQSEQHQKNGIYSAPLLRLPYALVTHADNGELTSMEQLSGKTLAIPSGWSLVEEVRARFPKVWVVEVESNREALEKVASQKVFATLDSRAILAYTARQYFLRDLTFGPYLSSDVLGVSDELHLLISPKLQPLVELFDLALSNIDGDARSFLERKWFDDTSVNSGEDMAVVPYQVLLESGSDRRLQDRLQQADIDGEKYFVFVNALFPGEDDSDLFAVVVPADVILAPSMRKVRWSVRITSACLLLFLPLAWLCAQPIVRPIRALFLKSEHVAKRQFKQVSYCPSRIQEFHDLSVSMVLMAGSIQHYEAQQQELMDSFIQLIAEAIDDKSPYTGGHCERVPELGIMLVNAAHDSKDPAFKDFEFAGEDERREFRVAAWLHDCGKVTMPEHIVDKGSKLETIYNRIHEVRMRFEVLWRDAHIHYLERIAADPSSFEHEKKILEETHSRLQEEYAFVAKTNVGGEFLADSAIERLQEISRQTWVRHFDDRLGLSPVEELRLTSKPEALPATERLLADKPDHIIERERAVEYAPHLGITMSVPEHMYNLGELYNLSIQRGTLTAEDRFKINEHIISTIKILDRINFPPELSRVPRYASTHHEAMNGGGYPRGLSGDQLSIPERVLVVADIFEALTASDRPYKKAKPLSVSVDILHKMVEQGHVDPDTFRLFLRSGVYLDYAKRYLASEQIDQVDIEQYL